MATLLRRPSPAVHLLSNCRALSTTLPRSASLQWQSNAPESLAATVPAYPHGSPKWYKQSRSGLYGAQRIQFGNNVSGRFETKTRRQWHPNIRAKKLYSRALGRTVQVRVSTRVLKTIDKLGGLDEYLLGEKEARIRELGESGWWLRWAIMQTGAVRERFRLEREALGLPAREEVDEAVVEIEAEEALATAAEDSIEQLDAEEVETEALAADDAFQIETSPELPPLRFRVGPRQHIMLTPTGWRRSIPQRIDPRKTANAARRVTVAAQASIPTEVLSKALSAATLEYSEPAPQRKVTTEGDSESVTDETAITGEDIEEAAPTERLVSRKLTLEEQVRIRKQAMREIMSEQMEVAAAEIVAQREQARQLRKQNRAERAEVEGVDVA